MKAGDRVALTPEARAEVWKYDDVGTRSGIVKAVGTSVHVEWDGLPCVSGFSRAIAERDLEVIA